MVAVSEFLLAIQRFIELGGWVLYLIMAVILFMWTLILERMWFMMKVHPKRMRAVASAWDARADTTSWYAKRIRDAMISQVSQDLHRNVSMIKTFIALCPLLGLLGTVTGMIEVFDVMSVAGTGNARAMADGVSKATVPTFAGMMAALSGVYFAHYLEQKADNETEVCEDLLQHH